MQTIYSEVSLVQGEGVCGCKLLFTSPSSFPSSPRPGVFPASCALTSATLWGKPA